MKKGKKVIRIVRNREQKEEKNRVKTTKQKGDCVMYVKEEEDELGYRYEKER